ncbi:DUF3696 domain-containing protein [Ferrimonas pelagia]|uniref:AAA domain-containing protein n=1 Tax=Ferrimonas pelagia TaxID=1177826 RepID=A0ABP9EY32_9GAMM
MRISKLSLTNFRSFRDTQTIDFAPVTLLFGPNSVGKSSVLMALVYLQGILRSGQCNPQRLEVLGNKFVGGFENLVNGKDLSKSIVIRVDYDMPETVSGNTFDASQFFIDDIKQQENNSNPKDKRNLLCISSPVEWANRMAVELEVKWSNSLQTAFVCRQAIWLDDEFVAESINHDYTVNAQVHKVNYLHPLLKSDLEGEWFEHHRTDRDDNILGEFHDFIIQSATSTPKVIELPEVGNNQLHTLFQYKSQGGVLPTLGKVLMTSIEADDALNTKRIEEVFSDIFVATLDNLKDILDSSLVIGPLRKIPDSTFDAEVTTKQKDWYTGRASWDAISSCSIKQISDINSWLATRQGLDLGFVLVEKNECGTKEYISTLFDRQNRSFADGQDDSLNVSLDNLVSQSSYQKKSMTLWDLHNEIEVTAADIGAGVSQVFPLVVAATMNIKGLICCEQPELHVHPKSQVALGDLLTQTDGVNNYLIETHSEHLILRLLRRIRETSNGELEEGLSSVSIQDVSIVYLESTDNGVVARRTSLSEDGDLTEDWPQGFFEERDGELF